MKVKMDETFGGVSVKVSCGGIFRDHFSNHVGRCNFNNVNVLFTDFMKTILTIEHAYAHDFWLELDSKLVVFSKIFKF